jgi:selenophosphate synthase
MLVQMLAGCLYVLKRETCALVGGHTAEGTECSMGLAVSGVAHPDKVFHKGLTGKDMKKITLNSDHDNDISGNSDENNSGSNSDCNGSIGNPQRGISKIEIPLGSSSSSFNAVSSNGHLGHVLVLTKALGTGTIMAAHMRAKVLILT